MNYDYMVAEHVNRIGIVTTTSWFTRWHWHWRWKRRSEDRHANTLAYCSDGHNSPDRMDNRLCWPDCNYIHASTGIIPCMYDKKTVQINILIVCWSLKCKLRIPRGTATRRHHIGARNILATSYSHDSLVYTSSTLSVPFCLKVQALCH